MSQHTVEDGIMNQPNEAQHAAVDGSPTRRAFYIGFINGVMGLIGLALAAPAAIYLLFLPSSARRLNGLRPPTFRTSRPALPPRSPSSASAWTDGTSAPKKQLLGY